MADVGVTPMKYIAMAWIGPTTTGHGSAICGKCGWATRDRNYGTVALQVMNHEHYGDA